MLLLIVIPKVFAVYCKSFHACYRLKSKMLQQQRKINFENIYKNNYKTIVILIKNSYRVHNKVKEIS